MPVISAFYGIVVRMYYREHDPPHFHAEYAGQHATFSLEGRMLAGTLRSRTALRLIEDWAVAHHAELAANWDRIGVGEPLERIDPLE